MIEHVMGVLFKHMTAVQAYMHMTEHTNIDWIKICHKSFLPNFGYPYNFYTGISRVSYNYKKLSVVFTCPNICLKYISGPQKDLSQLPTTE
jgi:hypothetical protein